MTANSILCFAVGIALTFLPQEILSLTNVENSKPVQLFIQIAGGLYFAFGMLNWMSKKNVIGGIYSRPITVANFTHFTVAGLALIKGLAANPELPVPIWVLAIVYTIFAVCFGILLFQHPACENKSE
jgi:uncharacterized membrane protein YidH (DUF202 family)